MLAKVALVALVVLAAIAVAADADARYVIYTRSGGPRGWAEVGDADAETPMRVTLALRHRNVEWLAGTLDRIADPDNAAYGQWLTLEEVTARMEPPRAERDAVKQWLVDAGVAPLAVEDERTYLRFVAPVRVVERVFATKMVRYRRAADGLELLRQVGPYSVPARLADTVTLVRGVSNFPPAPRRTHRASAAAASGGGGGGGAPDSLSPNPKGMIVPWVLQQQYQLPVNPITANVTVAVVEFNPGVTGAFGKSDLAAFAKGNDFPVPQVDIRGPYDPSAPNPQEANLDISYASALSQGAHQIYMTVEAGGWIYEMALALQAMTNSPPDVVSISWGSPEPDLAFNGMSPRQYVAVTDTELMKLTATGLTIVASSGDAGASGGQGCAQLVPDYPATSPYVTVVGATMLAGAGAQGTGEPPSGIGSGAAAAAGSSSGFFLTTNSHPAPALGANRQDPLAGGRGGVPPPRALAAGARRQTAGEPPVCKTPPSVPGAAPCAKPGQEAVSSPPSSIITSGGGFSTTVPRPAFQATAVQAYLSAHASALPPQNLFNSSNRAYPDVASNGARFLIHAMGAWEIVYGTSCSAPSFAAVVAQLNNARLNAGKARLGWMNPLLYKMAAASPDSFNRITEGTNRCTEQVVQACCKYGYEALPGEWSPTAGLGTINYPEALKYVMSAA